MYIYNVTINIDAEIEKKWIKWMQEEHIPEMLATGKFHKALMTRVMTNEDTGITYSVQYTTPSKAVLEKYYEEDAERLREKSSPFAGRFIAFRTELQVVDEFEI